MRDSPHREDRVSSVGSWVGRGGPASRKRCRSFTFLERAGERWSVFLVTYPGEEGGWRGYFLFRGAAREPEEREIRTADVFVEASEAEIDARARGLGRPLVMALLESALHTRERGEAPSPDVRRWFRELLAAHSAELMPVAETEGELSLPHLRSLYDSYRIDQVTHLVALIPQADFRALVERVLEGREIDFRARDRLQLAMLVVQELERYLPLPPFETWVEDYVAHREEYQQYTYALHRGDALP